jgi:hypothetical protein
MNESVQSLAGLDLIWVNTQHRQSGEWASGAGLAVVRVPRFQWLNGRFCTTR